MRTIVIDERSPAGEDDLPELDDDGLLRRDGAWVATSPKEELALRELLRHWRRLVSRQRLADAAWPEGVPGASALSTLVHRLRRRIRPLGLTIKTIRSRGFVMEPLAKDNPSTPPAAGDAGNHPEGSTWLSS
jgi:DNA-binding winged helix-turn-helix (wHTH) protein